MEDKHYCPFYKRYMDSDECGDIFMVASRLFKDESLVKEEDRDKLVEMCYKCGKYKE